MEDVAGCLHDANDHSEFGLDIRQNEAPDGNFSNDLVYQPGQGPTG
jgi:hypothetical protein